MGLADIDQNLPHIIELSPNYAGFFSIPDLPFGPSNEPIPTPTYSTESANESHDVSEPKEDVDIWILANDAPVKAANYQSWDAFSSDKFEEPYTAYLSEASPGLFDTALAAEADYLKAGNFRYNVVDANAYAASLLALGLGRSSIFFTWVEEKHCFQPTLSDMRISSYTGQSLDDFLLIFLECGNVTKFLQNFVDRSYSANKSQGRIALADAVSTLLNTIQSRLSASAFQHESLLQLEVLFQPAHVTLTCFKRIVMHVLSSRSDEAMLSTIFEEMQLLEHRTDYLRDILLEILSRVSQPWLEFASEWLGLQREAGLPMTKTGAGKSFVKVENRERVDELGEELEEPDYVLDYDRVPSFISPEDARVMFEVGRSLRFLKVHHSDHPLARPDIVASANPPPLEWKYSWQDIVEVEAKALKYERDLTAALHSFSSESLPTKFPLNEFAHEEFRLDFFGKGEEDMQAHVLASIDIFDQPFQDSTKPDHLSHIFNAYLTSDGQQSRDRDSMFAPPISLTPLLSFNPIISAQARIVNRTCMRMFFNSHNLRDHLSLQRDFHLLGNGVFSSRLSHALFDPELESAERHRGVVRSGGVMGLRLAGRDNWPPASSELHLALMGVLTESYISRQPLGQYRSDGYRGQKSLPGDLSFAVRDMSLEEIDKCMDPNSVEALDFLRLVYKPPPPLEAVITPMILFKYDQLFKLLLRVVRMLYVVSALHRDATDRTSYWQGLDYVAQKFRIEAHHFISSVSGYFFDTGIEATWRVFERKLDEVERRINLDDTNISLGQNEGLDKLRDYHERVLDRIMFALLLRKRQQPVMKLLEEIFTVILQFSKHSRERAVGSKRKVGADEEVRDMYLRFRNKVGVFITVCRGLSERKGYGEKRDGTIPSHGGLFDGNDLTEENTVSQLLARLEMSNYYSKSVEV